TIPWRIGSEFFFAFLLSRSAILGLVRSLVMLVWVKLFCEYSYFGPKWTEKAVVEIQARHRSRIIEEMGCSIERGNSEETALFAVFHGLPTLGSPSRMVHPHPLVC
ncbi:hypothetical protein FOC4_g10003969, partial [Fusarium odoratissimum]